MKFMSQDDLYKTLETFKPWESWLAYHAITQKQKKKQKQTKKKKKHESWVYLQWLSTTLSHTVRRGKKAI